MFRTTDINLDDDSKNKKDSDSEDNFDSKGKVLIGKMKRKSSKIFRSVEEEFCLNKGWHKTFKEIMFLTPVTFNFY